MRLVSGVFLAASLAGCVTHQARFVDIDKPRAAVVAELSEKAKAETQRDAVSTETTLAADSDARARREKRRDEINEELAELLRQKLELLQHRLAVAREMTAAFDAQRARCNSVTDWHLSPARCSELSEIVGLGKSTVAETEQGLATTERRLEARSDESSELSPPGAAPAIDVPAFPEDLSIEGARELVAKSEGERALDRSLEAKLAELGALPAHENIDQAEIEVSPYGNLRLARYDHVLRDGKRNRELREINKYRVIEIDGTTRILREGEEEFDAEVARFLGFEDGSPCLFGELKPTLQRCPGGATGASAGSIHAVTYPYPRFPVTPRSLPYYAYDGELGSMLGLSGGLAAGVQLQTEGDGHGVFSRWKLAALAGVDVDLGINVSKESESEPRFVAAATPELILRGGRSEVFHLEPGVNVETRRETLLDLAAGPRFDSYGRHGLSLRATLRPGISLGGVTVRYSRYADGRGSSVIVGLELADEASILPAVAIGVATPLAALVYLLATCDDPSMDHCGNQ